MKTILCYGDSNTWGYDPATAGRFSPDVRWTGVLAAALGSDYRVIEEGLNGRTTVWDDPIEEYRSGKAYLPPCLMSHAPLDFVVLMLGTNDLKTRFNVTAPDIAHGVALLVNIIQRSDSGPDGNPPAGLLVAPPPIVAPQTLAEDFTGMWGGGIEKSEKFAALYAQVAAEHGCAFFDAGSVITSSPLDGIHFEADDHGKLGRAIAQEVKRFFLNE